MPADDYRVSIGAQLHPKIVKMIRRCGYRGWWSLTNIWRHATVCKPYGRLTGMTIEDIEIAGDWDPDRPSEPRTPSSRSGFSTWKARLT